jgi:hypothetical protein
VREQRLTRQHRRAELRERVQRHADKQAAPDVAVAAVRELAGQQRHPLLGCERRKEGQPKRQHSALDQA